VLNLDSDHVHLFKTWGHLLKRILSQIVLHLTENFNSYPVKKEQKSVNCPGCLNSEQSIDGAILDFKTLI